MVKNNYFCFKTLDKNKYENGRGFINKSSLLSTRNWELHCGRELHNMKAYFQHIHMWPWKAKRTLTENRSNGKNALMMNGCWTVRKPFERMNNYLNGLVGHSNGLSNGLANHSNGWINHSNSFVSCSNRWLNCWNGLQNRPEWIAYLSFSSRIICSCDRKS